MNTPSVQVLVVDDEEDLELLVRQKFRRRIRNGELKFLFARNGKEALHALEKNPDVHLVLSDINMPVMDGLTLLNQLATANPDVQAVIISAYGDMANIRTAMNRGAFDFLTKPIDFNDLEITIEKTIRHVRALQAALEARDCLISINQELEVARQVQMSVRPKALPDSKTHEISAVMIPAREVGGDFYDFFELGQNRLGVVIADVSGKGVPAALFTMVTRALLKAASRDYQLPAECLTLVNNLLCEDNDSCIFITLFYGVLELDTGVFEYSNAGHNLPRIIRTESAVEVLPPTRNLVLGIQPDHQYHSQQIQMNPGDTLFLYTDGITEAENVASEEFGEGRLDYRLSGMSGMTAKQVADGVVLAVREFVGDVQQSDDITCLVLQLRNTLAAMSGK